jgi:competence protein ComEC
MSLSAPARFSLNPVLWLAAAFAAGIGSAHLLDIPLPVSAAAGVACGLLALLFRKRLVAMLLILVAFVAAGAVAFTAETLGVRPDRIRLLYDAGIIPSGDPVEIEGVLIGSPEPSVEGHFLTLRSERLRNRGTDRTATGRVRLFVPISNISEDLALKHGSRVIANCILEREDQYLNPGVLRRPAYLDQIGIDAVGSVKSPLLIEHIADEGVFLPLAWIYDQRANLVDTFTSELSPKAAGVMTASLLGDKYFLDSDTAEVFREGGTFHVLVISGLHITFIGGILLLAVRRLTRNRWAQFLLTAVPLWAYTLAVGAEVPVIRAAVMFTALLLAHVIYRPASMLNSLGLCSLLILAWRPSDLFNPSFHLTFVSVAAIVAVAYPLIDALRKIGTWTPSTRTPLPPNVGGGLKRFCETLYWDTDAWAFEHKRQIWSASLYKAPYFAGALKGLVQKAVAYIFEGILVSVIVQLSMLPLLIIYFHRVSIASIFLNLWVGVFIGLESLAAVLALFLNGLSSLLAAPMFLLVEVFNWLTMLAPRLTAGYAASGFRLPAYTGAGSVIYIIYFAVLIALTWLLHKWVPTRSLGGRKLRTVTLTLTAAFCLLLLIIIFHPFSAPPPDGRLKIDFLDVGQGDAALVTFPDGRTMLVDGGGRMRFRRSDDDSTEDFEPDVRRIGESVVSEFLWERGYSHVDYMLATHADADHMQGLADVANNFTVGSALIGRIPADDPEYEALRHALYRRSVPTIAVSAGDSLNIAGVIVDVLHPNADAQMGLSNNDSSVVVRFTFRNRSFLLTGDIEAAAEAELISKGILPSADVVKVPHHGSRTSSTLAFVDSLKPGIAIISVGRSSPFGHPHPEVVERWRAYGAEVRTTGEKGLITISTDGSDLNVSTFIH